MWKMIVKQVNTGPRELVGVIIKSFNFEVLNMHKYLQNKKQAANKIGRLFGPLHLKGQ